MDSYQFTVDLTSHLFFKPVQDEAFWPNTHGEVSFITHGGSYTARLQDGEMYYMSNCSAWVGQINLFGLGRNGVHRLYPCKSNVYVENANNVNIDETVRNGEAIGLTEKETTVLFELLRKNGFLAVESKLVKNDTLKLYTGYELLS